MNITPSGQTLILANERADPAVRSGGLLAAPVSLVPDGSVLTRVTVMETRPDSTVLVFRADYAAGGSNAATSSKGLTAASNKAAMLLAQQPIDVTATEVDSEAAPSQSLDSSPSSSSGEYPVLSRPSSLGSGSYMRPMAHYARIQADYSQASKGAHLDVRV